MDKIVYHGSNKGDIEELLPHKSTHRIFCIYAAENRVVPLLFMSRGNGDLDHRISVEDGILTFVERREGILKTRFSGVGGYLYELDGASFNHYDYLWDEEVISFAPSIKPLKKTYIPDIYEEILKEEEKGNIKIYHYPDRPGNMPMDNSDLIDKYIGYQKKGIPNAIERLLKIYPEFEPYVKEKLNKENNKAR